MSFSATTIWDVRTTGADGTTGNAGAFDPGATMATDLAATVATSSAPVVTSASYAFAAGDVGAWLFVKSGTNWTPGWYPIASVSAGAATLSAAAGAGYLYEGGVPSRATAAAGCATTASPTGGTWSVDYSQSATARITFSDLAIDATTNTKFASAANPVGPNFAGNAVAISSGTGFTVHRYAILSVAGTVATCDRALGTVGSTGGAGKLGGCLATPGQASAVVNAVSVGTTRVMVKSGTYTLTNSANVAGGKVASSNHATWTGWDTTRVPWSPDATRPVLKPSANSVNPVMGNSSSSGMVIHNFEVDADARTGVTAFSSGAGVAHLSRCKATGTATGFELSSNAWAVDLEASGCGTGFTVSGAVQLARSTARAGTGTGFAVSTPGYATLVDCLAVANAGVGFQFSNASGAFAANCTAYGQTGASGHGFAMDAQGQLANCVAYGNSAYGFQQTTAEVRARLVRCAAGSNASGNLHANLAPHQRADFVTLTADPFADAAGGDFRPNDAAGGGALLRAAAAPQAYPGYPAVANAADIGAYQSTAGGGGATYYAF